MRRLLLISIIIAALGGCDAERMKMQSREQNDVYVVEIEGHKYVVYNGFYAGGIVHAESCSCKLKTLSVNDVLQNRNGVIIRFRSRKNMTTEIITHESVHAAAEIMRYVGGRVEVGNQEPFAYLAGWVADCCDQVKKNKFKP